MSAPSTTVSQTDFLDAMSRINVTSEPPSGCDTPIPIARISYETLNTHKPIVSFRRLPNLRNLLTNSCTNYPPIKLHKPILKPNICSRVGKCTYCPLIKNKDRVSCNFTKKSHKTIDLPKHITCEISNVIYLITCSKCQKHYVGETSRALRIRMYEHKSSAQKDGQITPVSRHFKSDGHSHKHMQFTVLEWCTPKFESSNTSRRRRTELSWIFRLHSLAPIGINQFV